MIPEQLKGMFGLKDQKDMNMANNIWKMLDDMAESNPADYKNFIEKNMKENIQNIKQQKQEKQKPFRIKPNAGFLLKMSTNLNVKILEDQSKIESKVTIKKQNWNDIQKGFLPQLKIYLNVCFSDRVREPLLFGSKQTPKQYKMEELNKIQLFYYSLQGPVLDAKDKAKAYFCMILNEQFFRNIIEPNNGRRVLMGLCLSYFQERLRTDKNFLLKSYNPEEYKKLAYYEVQKISIEISQKNFIFQNDQKPGEFLLEKQIDKKRINQEIKEKQKISQKKQVKKAPEIKFKKEEETEDKKIEQNLNIFKKNEPEQKPKKILIEVLKEEQIDTSAISYELKETAYGHSIQFFLPGVTSINEIDLEIKSNKIKILVKKGQRKLQIDLSKHIDEESVKAKFKKKEGKLLVNTLFL